MDLAPGRGVGPFVIGMPVNLALQLAEVVMRPGGSE